MCETIGAYRILSEAGHGAFGTVYRVENVISGRQFALKLLHGRRDGRELAGLIRYRECRHANLLPIHHLDRLPDGRMYYTMDLADNRAAEGYRPDTLAARGRVPAQELRTILNALLDAVAALHRQGLVHRDIKPENVLFVNAVPVLGDLGLVAPGETAEAAGTPGFLPPEARSGQRIAAEAGDLFALGRTAYVALTGNPPECFPGLPDDLPKEAAPILAFCRAAGEAHASVSSCREALAGRTLRRRKMRQWGVVLAAALLAGAMWGGFQAGARYGKKTAALPALPAATAVPTMPGQAGTAPPPVRPASPVHDAVEEDDEEGTVFRRRQAPTEEEYLAEVERLRKKYPYAVPEELARRAEERYDAVNRDFMQAALLPDGLERRKALAREEKRQRELSRSDKLYRLAELSHNIDFYQNAGGTATTLQLLNNALRERQELAAELLQEEKNQK